jgi:hypothetical protein
MKFLQFEFLKSLFSLICMKLIIPDKKMDGYTENTTCQPKIVFSIAQYFTQVFILLRQTFDIFQFCSLHEANGLGN